MRSGKTQFAAIVLAVIIAFGFGLGGGVAGMYLVNNGYINLPGLQAPQETGIEQSSQQALPAPASNSGTQNEAQSDKTKVTEAAPAVITVSEDVTVAEAIADKVLPSVVGISTVIEYQTSGYGGMGGMWGFPWGNNYGGGQTYEGTAIGTGVIVDEAGYILTNAHVINDGDAKSITVSLYDGSDVEANILWYDSTLDLAVLKIEAEGLTAAELGDSDLLKIGSYAAAIGNPLGLEFQRSMSQGIISGLDRSIEVESSATSTGAITMEGLLQTDATINSGNSGGPLLNSKGQVIGINTAKASDGEGMGFAIPINVAKPIVEQIKETGQFVRPYIGISGASLEESGNSSEVLKEHYGTDKGIYVYDVTEGGGAYRAGIQKEDIITEVNGIAVGTMNRLNSVLVGYKPGDTVTLTVIRGGSEIKLDVTLTDGRIFQTQ
ncbi:MAG: trypsin-like peptidase domain-containing protein [Firmicutes bacterium]|nr:trypsin-like peptidase domain-containing protein [Bacillota bacterium]